MHGVRLHSNRNAGRGVTSDMARTDWLRLNSASTVWKKTSRIEMEEDRRPNTHGSKDSFGGKVACWSSLRYF